MLWILYNLLFPLVFLLMLPKFLTRMIRRGGYRAHFEQRIGIFGQDIKARFAEKRRVWVHAVSVGEIYVALKFIRVYRSLHPDTCFALSTTTSTAHAIARREIDPRDELFYFPVDIPIIIRKVLRIVNPLRIVLVEGEFWPNLIRLAHLQDIPVSLINGRLSESSYRGYCRLKPLTADVLRRIDPICVQSGLDEVRMLGIGAPKENVHCMGTAKFDVAERDPAGEQRAREVMEKIRVPDEAVVLLGGSTWPGEEAVLCDLYCRLKKEHPRLFLVLVPRHVERAEEVVACLEERGMSYVRRSRVDEFTDSEMPDVLFVDTTGELRNFYSVADIIFVGKSLLQHGGQNPIEPALCGKAVVVGPNMENFPAVMPPFMEKKAIIQVEDAASLEEQIGLLLADEAFRDDLGRRAAGVVAANTGVVEQTVRLLNRE